MCGMKRTLFAVMLGLLPLLAAPGVAPGYVQVTLPVKTLPETHAYQKTLRAFLGTLGTNDYAIPPAPFTAVTPSGDDERYALWVLTLQPIDVAEIRLPAEAFTLAAIESSNSLALPANPHACQPLAWLATWDYAGNPYRGMRAVKLRALTLAMVDLCMLDALHETDPRGSDRSDYLGGNLIWIADTFRRCQDALPPAARQAFAEGLGKLARRLAAWGPKGMMTDMDLFAPVGLWYAQQALGDPEIAALARSYSSPLFAEPSFFDSAGYFVDNGCFDTSYNGISLYFGCWAALASDWPFARDALDRAYRLRAHLCFPDPDGRGFTGPSAMSSRTSGDPPRDQWQFPARLQAGGMLNDLALAARGNPDDAALAAAPANLVKTMNQVGPVSLKVRPWAESHWSQRINFAAIHAPSGHLTRARAVLASGAVTPPYQGTGTFIRVFGEAFTIVRFPAYAAAIHTGPVGRSFGHNNLPYGYGGGQVSVFWTPASGVAMAGRRRGVQGAVFDSWEEWRSWPVHAVSGLTVSNELVTSNRIRKPVTARHIAEQRAEVEVSGRLPKLNPGAKTETDSGLEYRRRIVAEPAGLAVETTVSGTGFASLAELAETIPFFIQETAAQTAAVLTVQSGGLRLEAAPGQTFSNVTAIQCHRFAGGMEVQFERPRAVRFSPLWFDGYQTRAKTCTALVDLLDPAEAASTNRVVRYTIRAGS